ncbi:hypothetical protein PPL_09324 [Heterostelium album PN500]|uniref:F-box domain-containing protein n=1 Tax=Heterostelium pallidum (strain ATCC 26659 / Pp 5 / PN500) TaxID=670386 RepID=D3BL92_HETP5|nr:hypothetical protein PPL_09324 [Heterostelium album PN500]EFA77826.1 hypothetical protein PPL_09324 [Heterostelium album PN500]|eukprot:XP_020429954.1 hypothetical protein PPL_09324 [Heterostelium album PN500]
MPSTTIITQSSLNLQLLPKLVGGCEKPNFIINTNNAIKLPYVVQLIILDHCMSDSILSRKWKLSLSLVSWSFHTMVSKLFHKLRYRALDDIACHLNSRFSVLKSINSIKAIDSSLDTLKFVNIDLTNLTQLTIKSDITVSTLQLAGHIHSLTSLSLLNPVDSADTIVSFLNQLCRINDNSDDQSNPIEYLEIQNIMIGNWQSIVDFMFKKRASLRHLVLGIIDSGGLDLLMKNLTPLDFRQLETIDIWARGDMAAFGKHVSTFPSLRSLNLSRCNQFNSLEQSLQGNQTITRLSLPQIQSPLEFRYKGDIEQWISSMPTLSYLKLSPIYLMDNNSNSSNSNSNSNNQCNIKLNVNELELEPFNSNSIDSNNQLQLSSDSNIKHLKLSFTGLERKYNKMLCQFISHNKCLRKLTCDYSDELLHSLYINTSIESLYFLNVPRSKLATIMNNIQQNNKSIRSIFIPMIAIDDTPSDFNEFKYCPSSKSYYFFREINL